MRGGRLSAFDRWADEHGGDLSPLERQFVDVSRALASRELEQARRSNRRLRALAGGLVAVLILTLATSALAVRQQQRASSAQRAAIARGMVAQADRVRGTDPRNALRLDVAANRLDPSPQTQAGLLQTLTSSPYLGTLGGRALGLPGLPVDPLGVLAPDGTMLVTASKDRKVTLWDLSDRTHPRSLETLAGHMNELNAAAFAPDGKTLATISDERIILWDLSNRHRPRLLSQYGTSGDPIRSIAYSPDGTTLATIGNSGVTLRDLADRSRPRRLGRPFSNYAASMASPPAGAPWPLAAANVTAPSSCGTSATAATPDALASP